MLAGSMASKVSGVAFMDNHESLVSSWALISVANAKNAIIINSLACLIFVDLVSILSAKIRNNLRNSCFLEALFDELPHIFDELHRRDN
jgi:hypothetical protein